MIQGIKCLQTGNETKKITKIKFRKDDKVRITKNNEVMKLYKTKNEGISSESSISSSSGSSIAYGETDSTSSREQISSFDSEENLHKRSKKKVYKNKKRYCTKNTYGIDSELMKLIDKLDNRITPKQEPFKEETGKDLKKYVERF